MVPRVSFVSLFVLSVVSPALAAGQPAQSGGSGAALYTARCISCHERGAVARAPSRDVISALSADRIVESLETGLMRVQGEVLSPDERRAIAGYLTSARPAAPPAVVRACEGAAAALRPAASDWQSWGVTLANDRFQKESGIAAAQVPNLELRWAFGFEGENAAAANPTIVGDRIFVGSASGRVFSLGLKDGCQHWMFKAEAGVRAAVTVAQAGGRATAYFGDLRATVYAVDAATGDLRWKKTLDEHRAARITGSIVAYEGRLYIPVSSTEEATGAQASYECCTFRGSLVALDAMTGDRAWQTFTIPEAATPRGKNKNGVQRFGPSGAGVWSAPTIDPATNSLYVATGDAYSMPAAPTSDAVMALDLTTGAVKWFNQVTAGDAYTMACGSADQTNCPEKAGPDHDFGQSAILVSLGNGKRALVAGQKSGVVHAFDPDDKGKKLWSTTVGKGGILGGIEWGSAADARNMYVPVSDVVFTDPSVFGRGGLNAEAGGGLYAIRLTDGKQVWSSHPSACGVKPSCSPALSAPNAAMPGAIFSGSVDGHFRAYAPSDGHVVWDFDTAREFMTVNGMRAQGGSMDVGGPAIANGVVATTSGYGQWGGMRGNVLLVFSVQGK